MSYRYYRPALKNSVDVQLQSAFSDGNWPSVIRLADRRAKSLNDPYYEAVRVCAESQLDTPLEKCAALVAVDGLVRKGTVPKDVEALELYEWACRDLQTTDEYAETLGVLRSRWVKANPKQPAAQQCLQACVQHWDLVNAQQIAATLDKAHANSTDRRYMFWSITLTYLLSISRQCPEGKQKLFGLLAAKQLEKAAELGESKAQEHGEHDGGAGQADRAIRGEEELILYFKVLAAAGTREEFLKRMRSAKLGAMRQFDAGKKELLLKAVEECRKWEEWDAVFDFCKQALSRKSSDGSLSLLAADWRIWQRFTTAAGKQSDPEAAFETVQGLLQGFIGGKSKVAQMYVKNIGLALLEMTFQMPPSLLPMSTDNGQLTPRVAQICLFLDRHYDKLSAFDDVKNYVTDLTYGEAKYFLDTMLPKLAAGSERRKAIPLHVLGHQFRYLLSTSPQSLTHADAVVTADDHALPFRCKVCGSRVADSCRKCLEQIVVAAMDLDKELTNDTEAMDALPELDKDPRIDLALVSATCLLKLAGLRPQRTKSRRPPLSNARISYLLQAVVLLDSQLHKTPNDVPLRLLTVQLYLMLGCGSIAYQMWQPLDVKRTIQDALSPLFFDRISSISPGLFQESRPLTEPLRSFYSHTLRDSAPVKIWDAFSAGSYGSILDMAEYDDRLRRSCTVVMSVVEERRGARAFGGRMPGVEEDPLVAETTDDMELVNVTDYGSLPNLESPLAAPFHEYLRLGPGLSNERAHLSLLAEQFHGCLLFRPPKDSKPTRPNDHSAKDKAFVLETLARLHNSLTDFLHRPDTPSVLTGPEETYYTVVSLLSTAVLTSLTTTRSDAVPSTISLLVSSIKTALGALRASALATGTSNADLPLSSVFAALTDNHALSTLRDTALAIKHAAAYVQSHNEKEAARDRSGASCVHKEVLAEVHGLDALAAKALVDVKARIKTLREQLGEGGWLDRVAEWAFGRDGRGGVDEVARRVFQVAGGQAVVEEWAGRVLESWRENLKGMAAVRMD